MQIRNLLLVTIAELFFIASMSAQQNHTWVSGSGSDISNSTCSFTAPCATFSGALANTVAGGMITAKDAGDFGAVVIGQSVTIDGANSGSITFNGSANTGINITAPATVVLQNLTINGLGTGKTGIKADGGTVIVDNCKIMNIGEQGYGIYFHGQGALSVKNTQIETLGGEDYGIGINGDAAENVVVRNTVIDASNYNYGFVINTGSGPVTASLQNVTILGGYSAVAANAGVTEIIDSMLTQSNFGVSAASGATVSVASSLITANSYGVCSSTGSKIRLDNNDIYDNTQDAIKDCGGIVKTSTTNKTSGTIAIPASDVSDSVTF